MKRFLSLLLLAGASVVLLSGSALGRGPISILSDADFTAENGVAGGTGTADDPYLIAGADVVAGTSDVYGVQIENTHASFVLRGVIVENAADANGAAIRLAFVSNGRLEGCTVSGSVNGIEIVSSPGIVMRTCVLSTTGLGLRVTGDSAGQFHEDIDTSNLLNNKEIYYYYGLDGATISGLSTAHLTVADSRNVTITGNEVVNGDGIRLAYVAHSTVSKNSVYRTSPVRTEHGVFLLQSNDNTVESNLLQNNRLAGVQLTLSSRNVVRDNQLKANDSGIRLVSSDDNQISGNFLYANVSGILLSSASNGNTVSENAIDHENTKLGISIEQADGNRIERNCLTNCEVAISLSDQATGNVIESNTLVKGAYGVQLSGSYNWILKNLIAQESRGILCPETYARSVTRGNEIRGNVFTDDSQDVYLNLDSTANHVGENAFLGEGPTLVADNGTGNSWTIAGVGNFWGTAAIVDANGDGVGDTPIAVYPSNATDNAPRASWSPAGSGMGVLGTLTSEGVTITNATGGSIQVSVLVADSDIDRWTGFRAFPGAYAERYPGILFKFDTESRVQFTMQTVLYDLDIAFFAADGTFAGGTTMKANSTDVYGASGPFQYAIELPSGTLARLGISDGAKLVLP